MKLENINEAEGVANTHQRAQETLKRIRNTDPSDREHYDEAISLVMDWGMNIRPGVGSRDIVRMGIVEALETLIREKRHELERLGVEL